MPIGKASPAASAGRQIAAPSGTADVEVQRRGFVETKTVIKERGVPVREERTYENLEIEEPGSIHATIDAGNRCLQALEYQSVETVVRVVLPVSCNAKAIKTGFKTAWEIVNGELESRAKWAAEVIKALVLMKRESEGKR